MTHLNSRDERIAKKLQKIRFTENIVVQRDIARKKIAHRSTFAARLSRNLPACRAPGSLASNTLPKTEGGAGAREKRGCAGCWRGRSGRGCRRKRKREFFEALYPLRDTQEVGRTHVSPRCRRDSARLFSANAGSPFLLPNIDDPSRSLISTKKSKHCTQVYRTTNSRPTKKNVSISPYSKNISPTVVVYFFNNFVSTQIRRWIFHFIVFTQVYGNKLSPFAIIFLTYRFISFYRDGKRQ